MLLKAPIWLLAVPAVLGLAGLAPAASPARLAPREGCYELRLDQPRQVLWGLGVEIQNDAIGSGNKGLPDQVVAVPHDLVSAERTRFYRDLLKGFRYCRLAMGLYLRGLDEQKQRIRERYPNQLRDLREMMQASGMEGLSVEYWSCAPHWKSTNSYLGGTLRSTEPAFLDAFGDALRDDVRYLQKAGFTISMWGLQNEAPHTLDGTGQLYSHCQYDSTQYYRAFKAVAPKIRAAAPKAVIMVDAWQGHLSVLAKPLLRDPEALKYVDAWAIHKISENADSLITQRRALTTGTRGKPVFSNEYEYFTGASDYNCINTAQDVMNWFCFTESPTWFWLHALKPTYNAEASGYGLGYWRPADDRNYKQFGHIKPGHWDYNPQNFNSLAGFLKFLPWNARRYHVAEDSVRRDQRIMAFRTPKGKLGLVLTNRSRKAFTFRVATGIAAAWTGHRYTPTQRQVPAGRQQSKAGKKEIAATLPPLSIEFWLQD